nr:hypothetical protein Iba_chr09aCG4960 [Ipomoea batatas]
MDPSTGHKASSFSVRVLLNIAGVEANLYWMTSIPARASPRVVKTCNFCAEIRESCPMEIFKDLEASSFFFSSNQAAKAAPIASATGSVRLTGSPSTPATATPRMYLPFCSLRNSLFSIDGAAVPDTAALQVTLPRLEFDNGHNSMVQFPFHANFPTKGGRKLHLLRLQ